MLGLVSETAMSSMRPPMLAGPDRAEAEVREQRIGRLVDGRRLRHRLAALALGPGIRGESGDRDGGQGEREDGTLA